MATRRRPADRRPQPRGPERARRAPSRRGWTSTRPRRPTSCWPTCPGVPPDGLEVVARARRAHHPRTRERRPRARLSGIRAGRLLSGLHPDRGSRHRRYHRRHCGTACCASRSRNLRSAAQEDPRPDGIAGEHCDGHHGQGRTRSSRGAAQRRNAARADERWRSETTSISGCSGSSRSPGDFPCPTRRGAVADVRETRRRGRRDGRGPGFDRDDSTSAHPRGLPSRRDAKERADSATNTGACGLATGASSGPCRCRRGSTTTGRRPASRTAC